jgi:truncated hemoglobin YjbI
MRKTKGRQTVDAPTGSLYDRLGGIYSIATVVDDFIDRIMVDERLNSNPRVDEAHHRVLPPRFKYLVTEMLAEAAGGPQDYTGRFHGGKPSRVADNPGRVARLHG